MCRILICCLTVVLMSTVLDKTFGQQPEQFPHFLCMLPVPSFNTITLMSNNSYFVIDFFGRFWNQITKTTRFENLNRMTIYRTGCISNLVTKNGKTIVRQMNTTTSYCEPFDLSFAFGFTGKCNIAPEAVYIIKLHKMRGNIVSLYSLEWSDVETLKTHMKLFEKSFQEVLKLDFNRRISAVLPIKQMGIIFIQDNNIYYVMCTKGGWQQLTGADSVKFVNTNNTIILGQIFGGDVDQTKRLIYLFEGRVSSYKDRKRGNNTHMVRKFVHQCSYSIRQTGLTLDCQKFNIRQLCKPPIITEKHMLIFYLLGIVSTIFFILLSVLLSILCYRYLKRKPRKDMTDGRPKKVLWNTRRLFGDPKVKDKEKDRPNLAKNKGTDVSTIVTKLAT